LEGLKRLGASVATRATGGWLGMLTTQGVDPVLALELRSNFRLNEVLERIDLYLGECVNEKLLVLFGRNN
jgi:hypothetical protein